VTDAPIDYEYQQPLQTKEKDMGFKEGDTVKVITKNSQYEGKTGEVVGVYEDAQTYRVGLEWEAPKSSMFDKMGVLSGFFESELELVDEKREALIELAETLDKARLQANAIEETADQRGIYGGIAQMLFDALELIFVESPFEGGDDGHNLIANRAYDSILDGNSVREALAVVEGK
jgi:hypothetical protein